MTGNLKGRILIIASYDGHRHPTMPAAKMLQLQHQQLTKLKHNLDKIVIVINSDDWRQDVLIRVEGGKYFPEPLPKQTEYEKALELFPNRLLRPNTQGSYGAFRDGYIMHPGYEWYYFLEDDYVFNLDHFDQLMIDTWRPGTTYLAELIQDQHASISNGMTWGGIVPDWSQLPDASVYDVNLQKNWHKCFGETGLIDLTEKYSTPFWSGAEFWFNDSQKPALIVPVQML